MIYKALHSFDITEAGITCNFRALNKSVTKTFPPEKLTVEDIKSWLLGAYIQDAMPNLTADERDYFLNANLLEDEDSYGH